MGLNTGSSERTGASAADPEPNTPSTGESEGAGSDSQPPDSSHPTYAKGWNETEDGWVYLTSDNQDSFCEGWLKLGDTWYWFDPTTHLMATGVVECNGRMYRFVDSGAREGAMTIGWSYDSEASLWYYARPSGVLECGWLEIGNTWYYFDEGTCAMQTGWLELDGAAYYFDESSGAMATGWRWVDGAWYSLRPTGMLERGWLLEGDTWYWLDRETGAMANGPCEIDGTSYGFYSSGAMASGWFFFDGAWYYASDSGVLQSGWLADSGCRYYLDEEVSCCSMAAIIAPFYLQTPCSGGFFISRVWKPPGTMAQDSTQSRLFPWAIAENAPNRVVFFSPYGPFMEKSAFVCR